MNTIRFLMVMIALVSASANAGLYTGYLSSAPGEGLVSDGSTWASPEGVRVNWEVSENPDGTYHYKYTFNNERGGELSMLVSHMIISLSDNIQESDLFNFGLDVESHDIGTFESHASNPGFPVGESIFGLKINMGNEQLVAEFDSTRQPMWGDFYAKDGGVPKNYAYNVDLGVEVANPHDYDQVPVDSLGNPLFKVLTPNSVPEPATVILLGLGGLLLRRKKIN